LPKRQRERIGKERKGEKREEARVLLESTARAPRSMWYLEVCVLIFHLFYVANADLTGKYNASVVPFILINYYIIIILYFKTNI
jgi:hypothetical protein